MLAHVYLHINHYLGDCSANLNLAPLNVRSLLWYLIKISYILFVKNGS